MDFACGAPVSEDDAFERGESPQKLSTVAKGRPMIRFCGIGQQAIIAASILKQNGFPRVEIGLASMAACVAADCPIVT